MLALMLYSRNLPEELQAAGRLHKPRAIAQGRIRAGPASQLQDHHRQFVGWAGHVDFMEGANAVSRLAMQGAGQHRKDGACPWTAWKAAQTKEQWQLSLQHTPWHHTLQSFPVCLLRLPSCWPSTTAQGECLPESESVCGPFKKRV